MNTLLVENRSAKRSFSGFELEHGLLCDLRKDEFPTTLRGWRDDHLAVEDGATHFGYVHEGRCMVCSASGDFALGAGMVFAIPGKGSISGLGRGIVVTRYGYRGFFHIGGPVEDRGRLKYIDGCTDSLLVPPVMLGDPCLNLLYFPPGIEQTQHTHPSMRVGIVASGSGVCVTPAATIPLSPGRAFVIHANGPHSFTTQDEPMRVIAYHPDSDFGPTHEDHPMINRTIVNGRSATLLSEIHTR
jgi:Cupin domain